MKKLLPFLIAFIFSLSINAQAPALSFTNVTGSNSITCSYPSINVLASVNNTTIAPLTYTWAGPAALSGTNVTINTPGNYTVIAFNIANSFSVTQVYSIGVNTIIPTSTVTPLSQNITCVPGSSATFTGITTSTLTNVTHAWHSPFTNAVAIINGTISIYNTTAPGTGTYCLTNDINGCSTCKTYTVSSSSGLPTYNISSPQQFVIGCGTASLTTINITNTTTYPLPGGPVSYTVLPPYFVGPTYTVGTSATYSANIPGTYTVIVRDNTNFCESKVPVTVIQNTVGPNINISAPTLTLSCFTPSTILTGSSTNTNVSFLWTGPVSTSSINTIAVNTSTNTTYTVTGNYTLSITNNSNLCKSTQTLNIYQSTAPPAGSIMGTNIITCVTPSINLTNASISNVPAIFFPTQPVIGLAWYGPAPQASVANISTYVAYTPGTYTLIAKDLNNGCTSVATKTVADGRVYPVVVSSPPFNINCPAPTATIFPTLTGITVGFTYSWTAPASATLSSYTTSTTIANAPGIYTITITNPVTSCSTTSLITVAVCARIDQNALANTNINIFPNPSNGIFNVDFTGLPQNSVVEIYSTLGVLVKKQPVISEKSTVNLQNEPSGLYIVYVISGDKAIKVSKIVKK
jgi:hypothetical protein